MTPDEPDYVVLRKCENCGEHVHSAKFTTDEDTNLFGLLYQCVSCGYKTWADWDHPIPNDIKNED